MQSNDDTKQKREEISLFGSLNGEWLKLALPVVRDVGPAAQTLGGILKRCDNKTKETFAEVSKIAERARLPVAQVRRHLVTLHNRGWIDNAGREQTRAGKTRRTCTIKLTTKTKSALQDYGMLPWWACSKAAGLPWSARAVLSIFVARLAAFKAAIERDMGDISDDEEFWGSIENMGGESRFRFSLDSLHRQTGLWSQAIVAAKRQLKRLGAIDWIRGQREDGGDDPDVIAPNAAFRVIATPTTGNLVMLKFGRAG